MSAASAIGPYGLFLPATGTPARPEPGRHGLMGGDFARRGRLYDAERQMEEPSGTSEAGKVAAFYLPALPSSDDRWPGFRRNPRPAEPLGETRLVVDDASKGSSGKALVVVNPRFVNKYFRAYSHINDLRARKLMSDLVDIFKQCYNRSPPALLFILAILGFLGWSEVKSVDSRVDQFATSLQQTREEMIKGFGDLRTTIDNGDNTVAGSLNQLTNAIVLRVDRLEQRGQP